MVGISSEYTFTYHTTGDGVKCVLVKMPHQAQPDYCIALENVRLAATTGCGYRPPGVLVCGYTDTTPGWIVGFFRPDVLLKVYQKTL